MNSPLNIYCDAETLKAIQERFSYVLTPLPKNATRYYKPVLVPQTVRAGELFEVSGGIKIRVFDQDHGFSRTLGYRVGNFGYSTDVVNLPDAAFAELGIHTWVLGCFSELPHVTHVHVSKALEWIDIIKPKYTVLMHLGPELDYTALSKNYQRGSCCL